MSAPTTFLEAVSHLREAAKQCCHGFKAGSEDWWFWFNQSREYVDAQRLWNRATDKQTAFIQMIQHGSPALLELGICGLRDDYASCHIYSAEEAERCSN